MLVRPAVLHQVDGVGQAALSEPVLGRWREHRELTGNMYRGSEVRNDEIIKLKYHKESLLHLRSMQLCA